MSQMRTNQGGSVASFVIVGIVLVALVAGGIYTLRHRTATDTPTGVGTNSPAPSPVSSDSKAPTPSKSASPSPSASPQPTESPAPTPAPTDMPATGPSDLLSSGIIGAILIGSLTSYAQSRRARHQTFNQ